MLVLYMGTFFRVDHINAANSPIYTCPGPYACVISTYLGIQFPDGSQQQTAYVGGAGLTGIGTIDSVSPSTNGAAASTNLLIMQSASSTRPGLVNNSSQTFSGVKTFSSAPNMSSLSASQVVATDSSKNLTSIPFATANTASSLVERDASGNFSAGTITASLNGTASGNIAATRTISTTAPLTGGGDLSANRTFAIPQATGSVDGYLSASDWTSFNAKQSPLTLGNLSDAGTDGISITGGTGAVVGSGTSISQHVADATHNGYISSSDWSLFNSKQAAGNYITALTSDVSASGPGSAAATVNSVGGSLAAAVNTATVAANAATDANTASTIVKRDSSGNFTAGTITAALTGTASGNPPNARSISTSAPLSGGGNLSADRTLSISQSTGSTDGYLSSTDWTSFNNKQAAGNYVTSLTGDVVGSGPGATATTVASVGGSAASDVNTATIAANAATNANTVSTIVKRDSSGNFSAGTITAALTGTASGNTSYTPNQYGVVLSGAANSMSVLAPDASTSKVLKSGGSSANPSWLAYDNANTASSLVARDASGNFSAGTITADLTGTASGNTAYTANNHGIVVSGSGNTMTVVAPDASTSKVLKSGGSSADPSWLAYDNANTASTLVARDASGNFSAGTITADLTGTASTATAANGLKSASTTVSVSGATAPTSGQVLTATSGSAATWQTPTTGSVATPTVSGTVTSFVPVVASGIAVSSGANVTATSTDGYDTYQIATAGANRTFTLPAVSVSAGRKIKVLKSDSGTADVAGGYLLIAANGSDPLIGDATAFRLLYQGAYTDLYSDGTSWYVSSTTSLNANSAGDYNYVNPISQNSSIGWGSVTGVTLSTTTSASNTFARGSTINSAIKIVRASGSTGYAYYRFQVDPITDAGTAAAGTGKSIAVHFEYAFTNGTNTAKDWKVGLYCTNTANYSSGLTYVGQGSNQENFLLPLSGSVFGSTDYYDGFFIVNPTTGSTSGQCQYYELRVGLAASSSGTTVMLNNVFVGEKNGPVRTVGQIRGTYTSDTAGLGMIGETFGPIQRLRSNSTSLTSATTVNVGTTTSITLTPGDYEIIARCGFTAGATTTVSVLNCGISKTSATLPGNDTIAVPTSGEYLATQGFPSTVFGAVDYTMDIAPIQYSVAQSSTTQVIYLVASSTFGVSTMNVYGSLYARRKR